MELISNSDFCIDSAGRFLYSFLEYGDSKIGVLTTFTESYFLASNLKIAHTVYSLKFYSGVVKPTYDLLLIEEG